MPAAKVRVDYEQLGEIARAFDQQAEGAQQMLDALQSNMSTLQGGDWVGKGADTFYTEMNSAVLPAVKRLVAAMRSAASMTTTISRMMKQAEDDAAALFRLEGAAASNAFAGGAVIGGGAVGAVSGFMRAKTGAGKAGSIPPPVVLFTWSRGSFKGGVQGRPIDRLAEQLVQFESQVIHRVFAELPKATEQFERLRNEGWKFIKGTKFDVDRKAHTITINGRDTSDIQAASIVLAVAAALS
jgi:WXG100 family type VII secretion target